VLSHEKPRNPSVIIRSAPLLQRIAYGTGYKITCVCLSFSQSVSVSVVAPTAANFIVFSCNFAQ